MNRLFAYATTAAILLVFLTATPAHAWKAGDIDEDANKAIEVFYEDVDGGDVFLEKAAGFLIFPKVYKAGIGIGGETGPGVLRVGDTSVDYYRTSAGSFGFQLGAQAKSIMIVFMTKEALEKFQNSSGWKVGVDGSVALVDIGAGKAIDTSNIKDPVVGFVFGSQGLMYNLTLEGSKISKLNPKKRDD